MASLFSACADREQKLGGLRVELALSAGTPAQTREDFVLVGSGSSST